MWTVPGSYGVYCAKGKEVRITRLLQVSTNISRVLAHSTEEVVSQVIQMSGADVAIIVNCMSESKYVQVGNNIKINKLLCSQEPNF